MAPARGYTLAFGIRNRAATMVVGSSLTLPVVLLSPDGDTLPAPASLAIVSRDPAAVRVDSGTRITTLRSGQSMVVAWALVNSAVLTDSLLVVGTCTLELRMSVSPLTKTLYVGESFAPVASLTTCGGLVSVNETFVWSALDPAVIRVDSLTGQSLGLRGGSTSIRAMAKGYGIARDLPVTVVDR